MAADHYHFVGVAGVGMSAIAQASVAAGHETTGSDRFLDKGQDLVVLRKLAAAGVRLTPQDGSAVTAATRAVVISTAIEPGNPDLDAALQLGIRVMHRSEFLHEAIAGRPCIAVTGTSGKSTVTGMIGWILEQAGRDPLVINGAPLVNWRSETRIGNFRAAAQSSSYSVIEADESDKSLLRFAPDLALITNISRDHFDMDETVRVFESFRGRVRGRVISPWHEPGLLAGLNVTTGRDGIGFALEGVEFHLPVPGGHNGENAALAALMCREAGVPLAESARALRGFRGMERRLERVGDAGGVCVFDDYAHNPSKISAGWTTLAECYAPVVGVWRPHGFGPLKAMLDGLTEAFATIVRPRDALLVLPVYDAGGTADRSLNSETLVERLRGRGVSARGVGSLDAALEEAVGAVRPGGAVVTMGARDPGLPELARRIVAELKRPTSPPAGRRPS